MLCSIHNAPECNVAIRMFSENFTFVSCISGNTQYITISFVTHLMVFHLHNCFLIVFCSQLCTFVGFMLRLMLFNECSLHYFTVFYIVNCAHHIFLGHALTDLPTQSHGNS